jgi:CheY-like chemotaxis protein
MEATKLIMERDPNARVVFVTAHALDEFKAQADAVGATSFISKPFRLEDIQKLLTELGF